MGRIGLYMLLLLAVASCKPQTSVEQCIQEDADPYLFILPPGFEPPEVPVDNELTSARVALGKRLFYDTRLSGDGTISCGSCHVQNNGFATNAAISEGVAGRLGFRNASSLTNVGYQDVLFMDGGVPNLELQVLAPFDDENEMDKDILEAAAELRSDATMNELSLQAYGREMDAFVLTRAIAAFERTLISGNSAYDQFIHGDASALSPEAQNGMDLFFSDETKCSSCHSGLFFTDGSFRNIGLYLDYEDNGRQRVTADPNDNGKFKVPTLRNIAVTAPYMHDGSLSTLEEVVDHFASGGMGHPLQDPLMEGFDLSAEQKAELIAFLESLTDVTFLENAAFAP